jgi:hypothetical protein
MKKDSSGEIVFESAGAIKTPLEPVPAHRVIHSRSQRTMLVGDQEVTREIVTEPVEEQEQVTHVERESWWVYALIIAAISLSVIFFHFYKNGLTAAATGNQQNTGMQK